MSRDNYNIEIPEGTLREGDKVVSVLVNAHGEAWLALRRDDKVVVLGEDIDWEPIERDTIFDSLELAWLAGVRGFTDRVFPSDRI